MSDDPNLLLKRNEWQRKLLEQCPAFESFFALEGYHLGIKYSGSGDSGDVESLDLLKDTDGDEDFFYYDTADMVCPALDNDEVEDILRDLAWKLAYKENPGFEINEGGQGTILLWPTGRWKIYHENNYVEVYTSSGEGQL